MNRLEQAFEDKYRVDHCDPMVAEDLARFTDGWSAALSEQTQQGEALTDAEMKSVREYLKDWGCLANPLVARLLSAQQAGTGEPSYTGSVLPLPKPAIFDPGRFGVGFSADQMHEYAARCMLHAIPAPKAAPAAVSDEQIKPRKMIAGWIVCNVCDSPLKVDISSPPSVGEPSTDGAKPAGKILTIALRSIAEKSRLARLMCRDTGVAGGFRIIEEIVHDALAAAPESTSEKCNSQGATLASADGEEHPTNRYLFKRLCEAHGIVLGQDNIARALKKIKVAKG